MAILVGCSGWSYDDWVGRFYPMELAKMEGEWQDLNETFEILGEKTGWLRANDATVILRDIVVADSGQHVASHLWFNYTKGFQALGLDQCSPGCRIKFR